MKRVGNLWNDKNIEIVEVNGEMYALSGWNGEKYYHCWKVLDAQGINSVEEDREYIFKTFWDVSGIMKKVVLMNMRQLIIL